ncbi:pyruvate kinase [soil metagenome]
MTTSPIASDTRTKIVATIGPASESPAVLDELLLAGVDVVRLNLSHGTLESHLERLQAVRAAAARVQRVVAVLADLPGPKVRAGQFAEGGCDLVGGARLTLVPGEGASSAESITVDYPTVLDDLQSGDRIVLGDGAIAIGVDAIGADGARCTVLTGGHVQGRPGVHLPSERLRLSTPTDEDLVYAKAMADAGVDFLAVSFVRSANDLRLVRDAIAPHRTPLVAKIETMPAVTALEAITAEADAVMVARGDLGIECPLEDVPHLQKRIIRHCVEVGVPVITATQMMESMITSPSPTRAEVSDIANAVFDGTDALMLSAETAIGVDPVGVVRTMVRIAGRAEEEASYAQWASRLGRVQRDQWNDDTRSLIEGSLGEGSFGEGSFGERSGGPDRITMAITHAAGQAAVDADAQAILCCTRSGRTARAMARFRPAVTLIGLSPDPVTLRTLSLSWGVRALELATYHSTDDLVWFAVERAVQSGLVKMGDTVLVLAGAPDRPSGASTDVLRIVRVS